MSAAATEEDEFCVDSESTVSPQQVLGLLQRDLLAADCLTTIFWAAMSSFRHDTVLRPFPPLFLQGAEHKDIEKLRAVFHKLPPLDRVAEAPHAVDPSTLRLLHWILSSGQGRFTLQYRPPATFHDIIGQAQSSTHSLVKPQCTFELEYIPELESRFHTAAAPYGTLLAYHGSQVENFHSITHNGLLNSFNKTSAFGEGTYLSTDLGVCLNWSPLGSLWPRSMLPHSASCVAVCEVIKHPSIMSRDQTGGVPSLQQKVPDGYFIIPNDELLRVKYILFFGRQKAKPSPSWLRRYWFVVGVALYLVFLVLLGVVNSRAFRQLYSKYAPEWPWR